VGWADGRSAFRRIRGDEHRRLFGSSDPTEHQASGQTVIVPWEGTHLWVEVITDLNRTGRLLAMAQHSRNQVAVLGYDSIPITSAATVAKNMTSHFARGMAAARRADRVAMISEAAAEEFRGVIAMGAGRRDAGPEVAAVPLAVAYREASEADLDEARRGLVNEGMPMVLVVGSHEPRKNHLAILHTAELLWREGLQFNLVLVGAGSWSAAEYDQRVGELTGAGRPIQSLRGLPDTLLWAAYRLAHCVLFPSLNEGFGLPVAESLSVGTPVITSNFGSMRDIVAPDGVPLGGLLVDPRDDASLLAAMRTMLTDATTYERLKAETAQHSERTWDEYAEELWSFLVDGTRPSA
jgi:glycosyltransferase involved in cell wall biosynthesis